MAIPALPEDHQSGPPGADEFVAVLHWIGWIFLCISVAALVWYVCRMSSAYRYDSPFSWLRHTPAGAHTVKTDPVLDPIRRELNGSTLVDREWFETNIEKPLKVKP